MRFDTGFEVKRALLNHLTQLFWCFLILHSICMNIFIDQGIKKANLGNQAHASYSKRHSEELRNYKREEKRPNWH